MSLLMHPALAPVRRAVGAYSPARMGLKRAADRLIDRANDVLGRTRALDALADGGEPVDVVVAGVYVAKPARWPEIVAAATSSRHRVRVALGTMAPAPARGLEDVTVVCGLTGGKFPNVNAALEADTGSAPRWVLVVDEDVRLGDRFVDRFVALAEALDLSIAQPALTLGSYFSHGLTRRRPWSAGRETRFVEIGPVTAFREDAAALLLPFPEDAGMGWGLDWHWPAVAAEHGLRMGIVDAAPVGHEDAPFGATYSIERAQAEGAAGVRATLPRAEALRTVATYRRVRAPR